MFVGHLALAFASKRVTPRVSLGWLVAAATALDLLWPLLLLDFLLLWDALRSYRQGRTDLRRELKLEARVRELRRELGIDPRLSSAA